MKHHASGRPIGKCKGCPLNSRTLCLARLEPRDVWRKGRCHAPQDPQLMDALTHPAPVTGAKAAKLVRRLKAHEVATTDHHNGQYVPGGAASVR